MSACTLRNESPLWSWTIPLFRARQRIERDCQEFADACVSARGVARLPYTRFFESGIFHTQIEGAAGVNALPEALALKRGH
jgi:hypothetical protein